MALYLKYRPRDFESLVGQDFIKETLQKSVSTGKTVGAYLLSGPRGTGKTSTARILSKAVNCKKRRDGNPCNECDICKGINNESLVDVIEIDAASHTGVDNIREIIQKAQFRPTIAEYKVYIIDEVHMLSKGAFNALLKILEEPPEYVKFILATTETNKVPETIISRCQRYDMKSISIEDIKKRLHFIAGKELIEIDGKSLEYIAMNAGGALRNAISLFEQLSSHGKIEYSVIIEKLGAVDEEELECFLNKLLKKDRSIIEDFEKLISNGKNIKLFFKECLFYTKNKSIELIKKGEDIAKYIEILEVLDDTYIKTKHSVDENTTLIIGILKIITETVSGVKREDISATSGLSRQEEKRIVKKTEMIKKEEISTEDIGDIFGSSENTEKKKINSETMTENEGIDRGVDVKKYLEALKKNGAKAMIIMSIKGASMSLKGNYLEMRFKTKFALNSVNNPDTISLLNGGLVSIGLENTVIKLI